MKGTGRWTVQEATEQSVAAPKISASLDIRNLSGKKEERFKPSKILSFPRDIPNISKDQVSQLKFFELGKALIVP